MIAAGRWYKDATQLQIGGGVVHADFERIDFATDVERVPWPGMMAGGPTRYRVKYDGLYLVTAVLTLIDSLSGGNDLAQVLLNQYDPDGNLYAGAPPHVPIARTFTNMPLKPAFPVVCSIATQVRLKRLESVSVEWSSDGDSDLIGWSYTGGADQSWIELARIGETRVNR